MSKKMSGNEKYNLLSLISSGTASALLYYHACHVAALLMLLSSVYFITLLWTPAKIKTPSDFHVIIIGAGVSGICMGKKLNDLGIKYTILEKAASLGGTWYENTYPGCACDIPSHLYSYSFFLNPNWSRAFSAQKEILEYLTSAACRFNIYPHIQFGKRIKRNTWNKETNKWTVETDKGEKYAANVVISGVGALHIPKLPDYIGMKDFKGDSFHTAQWKPGYNPEGKKVAVVGTGASAVQAVPNLSNMGVKDLTVFQRTPCWSPPRFDFEYAAWAKTMFTYVPLTNTMYRYFFFWRYEMRYRFLISTGNWITKRISKGIHNLVRKHIKHVVKDPEMARKLTPNFRMGCKRITPSDDYLASFNKENVHLVTENIKAITEKGVLTVDGTEHEMDTIVYATGFDLEKSALAYEQIGFNSDVSSMFSGNYPSVYKGITHPYHPNFFMLLGPGTGLGHNSIIFMIECQVNYAADGIMKMIKSGAKSIVLKSELLNNYNDFLQENMKGKVFADNSECTGWYRNKEGVNWTLWPLDLISYWWQTLYLEPEDYHFKY